MRLTVADLPALQPRLRQPLQPEPAEVLHLVVAPAAVQPDPLPLAHRPVEDPHVGDRADVGVEDRVEDQRLQRPLAVAARRFRKTLA